MTKKRERTAMEEKDDALLDFVLAMRRVMAAMMCGVGIGAR